MSKIRQAVRYERRAAKAQDRAHRDLAVAEHRAHRELVDQAIAYERKYTDGQFGQLNLVAQEHRLFHEREHVLYEDAIEKASTSITSQLKVLEADLERLRDNSHAYMTIERFEREHKALIDKMEIAFKTINEKIGVEEKVTLRSQAQEEMLIKIQQNNRWLIGILITVGIFGATTLLHVFNII